jgi:catechol 2,3-dioxygenase-like lactoylglutathione lyase family enzyme
MPLGTTIPALPAADVAAATTFYVERLGFTVLHTDGHFSVLRRDAATIHLWESADTSWQGRDDLAARPVVSGAESFLAGTASCRIEVNGPDASRALDDLHAEMAAAGVLHGVSGSGVEQTDFGTREFHVLDLDGNLLTFYLWR